MAFIFKKTEKFDATMEIISIVAKAFSTGDLYFAYEGYETEIEFEDNEDFVIVKIQLSEKGKRSMKPEFHKESEIKISIYNKWKWESEPYYYEDTVLWESYGFKKGICFDESESFDEQLVEALSKLSKDRQQLLDDWTM